MAETFCILVRSSLPDGLAVSSLSASGFDLAHQTLHPLALLTETGRAQHLTAQTEVCTKMRGAGVVVVVAEVEVG